MFAADLSWAESNTERVGERKERKAREKEKEQSMSSSAASTTSGKSSNCSSRGENQAWWSTSLRKSNSVKPIIAVRPPTGSSQSSKGSSIQPFPPQLKIQTSNLLRDPALQPAFTYTSTLSPTLPSGAPLDPPGYAVPELEGDLSWRGPETAGPLSAHQRRWPWKSVEKTKKRADASRSRPSSSHSSTTQETSLSIEDKKRLNHFPLKEEDGFGLDTLRLSSQALEERYRSAPRRESKRERSYYRVEDLKPVDVVAPVPLLERGIVVSYSQHLNEEAASVASLRMPTDETFSDPNAASEMDSYQQFIRSMENADLKIILERVKEKWTNHMDEASRAARALEKHLWILTAFQLEILGRYSRYPRTNNRKILELYGNLAEAYQSSAMHRGHKVYYLTTKLQQTKIPDNLYYVRVQEPGKLPLPYGSDSFSHIRASTLPSLLPSSRLPELFRECHRLLVPGGMLEVRVMDAAPIRLTTGPKMKAWVEDRLLVNLERLFRCSKPCALIPSWLADAGFHLPTNESSTGEEKVKLNCAFKPGSSDVNEELLTLVTQDLWKDLWGDFVDTIPGQPRWWWEDADIMEECLTLGTAFDCGYIFAFKS